MAAVTNNKVKKRSIGKPIRLSSAVEVGRLLWPDFVREHGCIFLARHAGSNPPPANDTMTGWESFVNHTHVFDEFSNAAAKVVDEESSGNLRVQEVVYDERHPDFVLGSELGRKIALLWALKLKLNFPLERFRVYYTQFDNPIVRFHKVREDEAFWMTDEDLRTSPAPSFRGALIFDTASLAANL